MSKEPDADRLSREIAEFNRECNEALLSMDEQRIRAMFRKWNESEMPSDPKVFWGAVHKETQKPGSLQRLVRRQKVHKLQTLRTRLTNRQ